MPARQTVAVAGAHGKIARSLVRLLSGHGDRVLGLIRSEEQADDVRADGAEPVICDLERAEVDEIASMIEGATAVVFAAGAGPGSGAERKWAMDHDGAVKLLEAARAVAAPRYVIVSAVGAEDPPRGDDVFSVYLRAKAAADRAVIESDRQWTVVRPGRLEDDPASGRVRVQTDPFRGRVPRDDVAAVLDAVLQEPRTAGLVLYVNAGDDPIEDALASVVD